MITSLLIGRKGSTGFPGKHLRPVLGHPLAYYPMAAAKGSKYAEKTFISTDCPGLMELAKREGIEIIERPANLCTQYALGEDVFVHGYNEIRSRVGELELIVLLHCNAATISSEMIDEGIEILRKFDRYDSVVSVSRYNMWSPTRARRIGEDGLLHPFVPFECLGDPATFNSGRQSQGDVYFADMSLSVVRPFCLQRIKEGLLPQRWMGRKIYPLIQEAGCDVDYEFQIPQTEYWIKKNLGNVPEKNGKIEAIKK